MTCGNERYEMWDDWDTPTRRDEVNAWIDAHRDTVEHLHRLWCERPPRGLNFCGCGVTEITWQLIHTILTLMPLYEDRRYERVEVLYVMDAADLIEHAPSITASYITPKGEWARWAISLVVEKWGWDRLDDVIGLSGLPHYRKVEDDDCGEQCWKLPQGDRL